MKLQVSSRLAIFALIELAGDPDRQVSVSEIGEKYSASANHLAKVMHTLGRAGLVRASRGVGGGYSFSGQDDLDAQSAATPAGQSLGLVLDEVDDMARAILGAITISTMLKQIERRSGSL